MTDVREGGLRRETLYAADATMRASGLVREVLRTTGSSGTTYMAFDGLVREVLRTQNAVTPPAAQPPRAWILM